MAKFTKSKVLLRKSSFSWKYFLVFLIVFAVAGYALVRIFAATTPGSLEVEKMKLPSGAKVFKDKQASGGKAVAVYKKISNNKLSTGTIQSAEQSNGISMRARAEGCRGYNPTVIVSLTRGDISMFLKTKVKSSTWKTYKVKGLSIPAKRKYVAAIRYLIHSASRKCFGKLYVDVIKLIPSPKPNPDPNPPPTDPIYSVEVTTTAATNIGGTSATVNGIFNNKNNAMNYYFNYGTTTSYGLDTTQKLAPASPNAQPVSAEISNLSPNTTYHYNLCAINSAGMITVCANASDFTFATTQGGGGGTNCDLCTLTTVWVSNRNKSSLDIKGTFFNNNHDVNTYVKYGTTTDYGKETSHQLTAANTESVTVKRTLNNLTRTTTYHFKYCIVSVIAGSGSICSVDMTGTTTQ